MILFLVCGNNIPLLTDSHSTDKEKRKKRGELKRGSHIKTIKTHAQIAC